MSSPRSVSRRDVLKTLGAGALLMGVGTVRTPAAGTTAPDASSAAKVPLVQPFSLPKLGYAFDALEPHIDARTMQIHYERHHQAYITAANKALADHPALRERSAEELLRDLAGVPEAIRTTVRNQVGGHVNHTFFWRTLAPARGQLPEGELAAALSKTFGSLEAFKAQFADTAMKRFGSGWAWLVLQRGQLTLASTANQDSPLSEGALPILGLDVWEHAYYLNYQNRRADYVSAFWSVVNWPEVAANYAAARAA